MSIQVNDFRWEPGKNDAEYIKLLESSRDEWQKIAKRAIAKLTTLSRAPEPVTPCRDTFLNWHCGYCKTEIDRYEGHKYCPNCGKKVRWE